MSRQAERQIELLEKELEITDDPVDQAAIRTTLREIERELAEQESWREQGAEKGWQ